MIKQSFTKVQIEIVDLSASDIIVTSPGIPLPDEWWDGEDGSGE